MRERALQVNSAIRAIVERTGRTPSTRDLARHLELEEHEVLDAQVAYVAFDAVSLDAPVAHEEHEDQPRSETIGAIDDGYELAEDRVTLRRAVRKLPLQDRRVLHMRFIEDRTQSDIANRIGVSQMQVSRILKRTFERLRIAVDRPAPAHDCLPRRAGRVTNR